MKSLLAFRFRALLTACLFRKVGSDLNIFALCPFLHDLQYACNPSARFKCLWNSSRFFSMPHFGQIFKSKIPIVAIPKPAGYRYHNPKQKILVSEAIILSVLCLAGIRNGTLSHFLSHEGYKLIQARLRSFSAQSRITLESFLPFSDRSGFRLAQSVSSNTSIECFQ